MDVMEKSSSKKRLIDYYYLAEKIECPGEPLVYWYDIEAAPTVDAAEVVHGRWEIVVGSNGKEYMVCTCCRVSQDLTGVFAYCPNCGAKMDGGED